MFEWLQSGSQFQKFELKKLVFAGGVVVDIKSELLSLIAGFL